MKLDPRLNEICDCLYRVSAKAIIIHDGKLLLSLEPEGYYSLPGGGIDYGESISQALKRELNEEFDFHGSSLKIDPQPLLVTSSEVAAYPETPDGPGIPRIQIYFRVAITNPVSLTPKELEFLWAGPDEFNDLPLSASATEALPELLRMLSESNAVAD